MATIKKSPNILKWYVLRTFSGHEKKVRQYLEREIERLGIEDKLTEIMIPTETVFEMRGGNDLSMPGWRPLFESCAARAQEVRDGLAEALERELGFLEGEWPEDLPAGVIHADLFPDNVFFLGGRLSGIIDFYFACNDFFAYDLATCLNAWCFEPDDSFNVTKARLLLQSYRKVRPFSAAELDALPLSLIHI